MPPIIDKAFKGELRPLLSFGHLPLKGKTPRWEFYVREVYRLIYTIAAKSLPFRGGGRGGFVRAATAGKGV
jgi:hypothetical protein